MITDLLKKLKVRPKHDRKDLKCISIGRNWLMYFCEVNLCNLPFL